MTRTALCLSLLSAAACNPEPETAPFEGPGWDAEAGALIEPQEEYLVGLTHLRVRNAPGPGKRFGEHAEAVATWLFEHEPEGWVGAGFRNVGKLDWWTMTVWESEEAQLEFVVGDVHAQAMAELSEVAKSAESLSLWVPAEEVPLEWDRALQLLADEPGFTYGEQ
jgi:hypothetical protein